jgi:hypothetical protein
LCLFQLYLKPSKSSPFKDLYHLNLRQGIRFETAAA